MRIQNESGFNIPPASNAGSVPGKMDGLEFGKVLSGRIKTNTPADPRFKCFANLVKDSFADPVPQAVNELENMCADETGERIDMRTLDDLLSFILNERGYNA